MKELFQIRQYYVMGIIALCGLIIVIKLAQIQIFDNSYSNRANVVTIARQYIYPSRGLIYDRNNKLLINNDPVYELSVVVSEMDPAMDTVKLCNLLKVSKQELDEKLNIDWRDHRFSKSLPVVLFRDISPATFAALQEVLFEFPGFSVQQRNRRTYPFPNAANILGYIAEANEKQIDNSNGKYQPGDEVGVTGLEKYFEEELRGRKGVRYEMKNNVGKSIGAYKEGKFDIVASAGKDIISSIDIDLQAFAEKLLHNKTGSIVAIQPSTGEILAMASSPSYDPNLLVMGKDRGKAFQQLLQDTLKPFFDRAIMAKYPPGSIFKTLVGLISLEEGLTTANRYIPCNGAYYYGAIKWGCHHHIHATSLPIALQVSCNTYFFTLTREIIDQYSFHLPGKGLNTFAEHLHDFGLGAPIGIDYPTEKGGNVPSAAYYDKLYKRRRGWRSPTIMSIGIGQGEIQLTTLQMANLAAIIANKGSYYIPHLVKGYVDGTTKIEERFRTKHSVKIRPEHFLPIIEGMERVVWYGTGRRAAIPGINFAGKTGTSQNPHGEDHSVFFGFAPAEKPEIAIAVIIENAGRGAEFAAPIASLVAEKYLRKEISRPALATSMEAINTIRIKPKRKRLPYRTSVATDSLQSPPLAPSEEPIQAQNEEKQ